MEAARSSKKKSESNTKAVCCNNPEVIIMVHFKPSEATGRSSQRVIFSHASLNNRGIRSEKCIIWRFHRCANVTQYTYTNLDNTAYYTPRLYGTAYCS
jgi:hypothetical protein